MAFIESVTGLVFGDLLRLFLEINAIIIIITIVFIRPRRVTSIYLWVAAFLILPLIFVLIFYVFFGRDYQRQKLFKTKALSDAKIGEMLRQQRQDLDRTYDTLDSTTLHEHVGMAKMLLNTNYSFVTIDNHVRYVNDGNEFFEAMFTQIRSAKRFIHLEMYIVRNDELGKQLAHELALKSKEGLEVKLLLDAVGCHKLPKKFFKELQDAGGKTAEFFPSWIRALNTRINNRNHRKLMIVDGGEGFCSGFNVGIEYTGRGPLGPWRDDAVFLKGGAAVALEARFIQDWNFAAKDNITLAPYMLVPAGTGKSPVQIVSGGPDTEHNPIEQHYVKMITSAKKRVFIQTPYFVPTDPILNALRMAAEAGLEVKLMIPCKPDHPFVFWASTYNAGELLHSGVQVYKFQPGFIHAKICVIDDEVASVGSANFDVRSFELNFETNTVIYDGEVAKQIGEKFLWDVANHSDQLTIDSYAKRGNWIKIKESISRLYSPIA